MNPKFKEIKKVELQQEGVAYMSAHSGSTHLSIVMASINGGLYVWSPRPAKIIQPLAPSFVEIEDNIVYVERESEFESEISSEEDTPEEQVGDGAFGRSLLAELTKKQRKLAKKDIDIFSINPMHQVSVAQALALEKVSLNTELDLLFLSPSAAAATMQVDEMNVPIESCYIETRIDVDDSFAVMARRNLDFFRGKFDKLLQQQK